MKLKKEADEDETSRDAKMDVDDDESRRLAKKRAAARKRKAAMRKKRRQEQGADSDNERMTARLKDKFGQRTKNAGDHEEARIKVVGEKSRTIHPLSHNNMVARAEEVQANKLYQIEFRSDVIDSAWKCALCQQKSCHDDLGDLFGPYYVRLDYNFWPTFLAKKPAKMPVEEQWIDIWLHGHCALWAPDVHMSGSELTNLEPKLKVFWKQHCMICNKEGASIPVGDKKKYVHFSCASAKVG